MNNTATVRPDDEMPAQSIDRKMIRSCRTIRGLLSTGTAVVKVFFFQLCCRYCSSQVVFCSLSLVSTPVGVNGAVELMLVLVVSILSCPLFSFLSVEGEWKSGREVCSQGRSWRFC